jgi:hypothetical protein
MTRIKKIIDGYSMIKKYEIEINGVTKMDVKLKRIEGDPIFELNKDFITEIFPNKFEAEVNVMNYLHINILINNSILQYLTITIENLYPVYTGDLLEILNEKNSKLKNLYLFGFMPIDDEIFQKNHLLYKKNVVCVFGVIYYIEPIE